jgi:hypothetical protein
MQKRRMIAAGIATAALLLGGAGAIAAANTMNGPPLQGPTPTDEPDVPGQPDIAEPGDTPDAVDGPDVPGQPDLPEPGDTVDTTPPSAPPTP